MRRLLSAAFLVLVTVPAYGQTTPCTTVNPGPSFVCKDGGWIPVNQLPPAPTPVPTPEPTPAVVPTPDNTFWMGYRYVRGTTDFRIIGSGQFAGYPVVFAYCNQDGDGCYGKGYIRMFASNANTNGFTNMGPY